LPVSGANNISINPTLTWDNVSNATSYEVWFGESGNMLYIEDVLSESYTPEELNYNIEYQWQILPKNINGTATACDILTFTTISSVPECAQNPIPETGAENVMTNLTLMWDEVPEATSYKVYFGEAGSMVYVDEVITKSYSPPELEFNTEYEWQIIAKNNNGTATSCDVWTFTTDIAWTVNEHNSEINIYPNPTNGKISLKNMHFVNAEIIISDITGKVVQSYSSADSNLLIDLTDNQTGIYILTIKTDNKILTNRIIKN